MNGLHLTADLHGCRPDLAEMADADCLRRACLDAVRASGLTPVGELFHPFVPSRPGAQAGITGVVLLAESHVAIHTWPELAAVTLDVYVCNRARDNSHRAHTLLQALEAVFMPARVNRQSLVRGQLS